MFFLLKYLETVCLLFKKNVFYSQKRFFFFVFFLLKKHKQHKNTKFKEQLRVLKNISLVFIVLSKTVLKNNFKK